MQRSLFCYDLPPELIAQVPLAKRDESRLLYIDCQAKTLLDSSFKNLPALLRKTFGDKRILLIANDSKVYPARVRIKRASGARGEVFFLERGDRKSYRCLLRPLKKLNAGEVLLSDKTGEEIFRVESLEEPAVSLLKGSLDETMQRYGEMPLPPYIERDPARVESHAQLDSERYQTVYSREVGSSAAPTAGLHFSDEVLAECKRVGIEFATTTLHVGLGTFQPVQTEDIDAHPMHAEHYRISKPTLEKIVEYARAGDAIVFVGTTAFRSVESFFLKFCPSFSDAADSTLQTLSEKAEEWHETRLFVRPQNEDSIYRPVVGSGLITNFHQPESTLVMLVAALAGFQFWREFYSHAINQRYRFLSYGDATFMKF